MTPTKQTRQEGETVQHTPTPWKSSPDGWEVYDMAGRAIADCNPCAGHFINGTVSEQPEANAAFIVRAVNSHQALVDALEWAFNEQNKQGWLSAECWDVCRAALSSARQP